MSTMTKGESRRKGGLARRVRRLAPEALHRLIQDRGLEECGEVLAAATPAQLTALLDLDLWSHAPPGHDQQFDVGRFGEWLEALIETGDSVAARIVASLDTELVIAGFSRYFRAFDPGTFEPTASTDDEPIDRHDLMNSETPADVLECELGGYVIRARRTHAWDAIVALLVALESEHNQYFHAVMQGSRRLSNSRPELDGLHDLLLTPEQHIHDIANERDQRRSQRGYATAADARAFLQMARRTRHTPAASVSMSGASHPIVAAYFRDVEEGEGTTAIESLTEAGARSGRPRALLAAAEEDSRTANLPFLRPLMEVALRRDPATHLRRQRELGLLANMLIAGGSVQSRAFTPHEAADAAACVCNLGLECSRASETFLLDHDLLDVFESGWSVLFEDVSLFVAGKLTSILDDLRCLDADIDRGLRVLHNRLATQRKAGTPWLARDAADVLAMLDMTAWVSVLGLLDECPILPAALTAVLERRTTSVSATAFQFISTTAQIGDIRVFMSALPSVLSR